MRTGRMGGMKGEAKRAKGEPSTQTGRKDYKRFTEGEVLKGHCRCLLFSHEATFTTLKELRALSWFLFSKPRYLKVVILDFFKILFKTFESPVTHFRAQNLP